ncbi:MAG TPA: MEDS domain-containing protein [Nitrososphaera sp.]|nr:MEDS domain-containing protein [Nitrososphaera sp.]
MGHSHSICVFDADAMDKDYWQPGICGMISEFISQGYAVVYVVGQNENSTIQNFSRHGLPVEDYIQSGSLTIINKDTFYSPKVAGHVLSEQWSKIFSSVEKKRGKENLKGVVGIGMPSESFFTSELHQHRLVDYEMLVSHRYNGEFEARCCYSSEMFDIMPLKHIIMLLNSHQSTAHSDGRLIEWNSERCLEAVRNGLNTALGEGISELIFSVLLKDFGMDKQAMMLAPDKFESKLRFVLGVTAADIVLNKIKDELKRATAF